MDPDSRGGSSSGSAEDTGVAEGEEPPSSSTETNQLRNVSVLIVEDNPEVLETTAALLRETGYSVSEATDGVDALQRLRDEFFDVVILDVRLPSLDGPYILDALDASPPIVIASALEYFSEDGLRGHFGPKVFAFLQKPFTPERLLAVVASAARGDPAPQ